MQPFLGLVKYPIDSFKLKSDMNRFRKMVYKFDHSENFYTVLNETSTNRHNKASHLNQALQRIESGVTRAEIDKMK